MNKYNVILISFVLLFSISSCTEIIDIELNDAGNKRVVVDARITNQTKAHMVKLTYSTSYFANQKANAVNGANVSITDGTNTYPLSETNGDGIYYTNPDVKGEVDKTYTLNIELSDGTKYTASSYMASLIDADKIEYKYEEIKQNPFTIAYVYNIYLFVQEDPKLGNYYMWNYYIDGKIATDTLKLKIFFDDNNVNGSYIANWAVFSIEEEDIVNDKTKVTVEGLSISKAEYDFCVAFMLETEWKGGLFDGPPANIPSNISNGGLGFFSASAVTSKETFVYRERNTP